MTREQYRTVCRVLRLANHTLRGVDLALGELPPGIDDNAGIEIAEAYRAMERAIRSLNETRGPHDKAGESIAPFDDEKVSS